MGKTCPSNSVTYRWDADTKMLLVVFITEILHTKGRGACEKEL